jgi:hypothetical protein
MIDVVYLAYLNEELGYDLEVFEQFIASYKNFSSGIEHNFTVLIKKSTPRYFYNRIVEFSKKNNLKFIKVSDEGLDIGAFILAAKQLQGEYLFCIGSGMTILCNDWLLKFDNAFKNDAKIRLAGPMGTYAQGHSNRFPNPHIRTCAFMMKRDLFLEYADGHKFPETKEDTWEIEHCEGSLTNFVLNRDGQAVVVNSDGKIFYPADWEKAQTYITLDSKAIMDDKWARRYAFTDEYLRTKIEMENWYHNTTLYPSNLVKEFSDKINVFIPYSSIVPVYSTELFHPIFIGEVNTKLVTEALQDSTDANIFEKSKIYGELSAYYWVWKNFTAIVPSPLEGEGIFQCEERALEKLGGGHIPTFTKNDYIGFCQFYHFMDFNSDSKVFAPFNLICLDEFAELFKNYTEENVLNFVQDYDIVVPTQIPLNTTLYEQYLRSHKKEDLDLATDVIKEIYPEYVEAVEKAMSANSMYPLGNFIMKTEVYNDFCEWLFNILDEIEKRINWNEYGKYRDIVLSAFVAERFLNIWLEHNSHLKVKVSASFMVSPDERKFLNKTMNDINQVKEQIKKK